MLVELKILIETRFGVPIDKRESYRLRVQRLY